MTTRHRDMLCSAVLFDLDGVLVRSGPAVERSWRFWAQECGIDTSEVLAVCQGRTSADTDAAVAPHLDARAEAARVEARQSTDVAGLIACPGAADVLATIPAHRWAVVTSGTRLLAVSRLRGAGLPVPTVLVTADDVRQGKPAPEGYLTAAARLGVPAGSCVVVEDARPGVLAARAAGIPVVGVAGSSLGPADEVDRMVYTLAELAPHVTDGGIRLFPPAAAVPGGEFTDAERRDWS